MHELAITKELIRSVLQFAEEARAQKVVAVHLSIGETYGVVEDLIAKAFHHFSRNTICEDARLDILFKPICVRCNDCGEVYYLKAANLSGMTCPQCGCSNSQILSGDEFCIDNLEIV